MRWIEWYILQIRKKKTFTQSPQSRVNNSVWFWQLPIKKWTLRIKLFMILPCTWHTLKNWEQPPSNPPRTSQVWLCLSRCFSRNGTAGIRKEGTSYCQWEEWVEGARARLQWGCVFRVCLQGKGTEAEFRHLEESDQSQKLTSRTNTDVAEQTVLWWRDPPLIYRWYPVHCPMCE